MSFKFEKRVVWQRSLELTGEIHLLIRKFPSEERYALASIIEDVDFDRLYLELEEIIKMIQGLKNSLK